MVQLFDRIVLTKDLPGKNLKEGDVGTIALIHGEGEGYEVEFFTLEGKTYAVETLSASDIRPIKTNEVTHVRELT